MSSTECFFDEVMSSLVCTENFIRSNDRSFAKVPLENLNNNLHEYVYGHLSCHELIDYTL